MADWNKSRTFAHNRTRRRFSPFVDVAYQSGTFFVYTVMRYTKQLLTLQQQIDILKERGLLIENEDEAKNAFDTISYFRLAGYWRLMEADRQQHTFKPGSRFSQIMSLYHFDEKLRILVFSAIQQIEVAVRARMILQRIRFVGNEKQSHCQRHYGSLEAFEWKIAKSRMFTA